MSEHRVEIAWSHSPHPLRSSTYCRDHTASFSNEEKLNVSAAAEYLGNDKYADPEKLLVNALASCHMLFFLALSEAAGYVVMSYSDSAVGTVAKREDGVIWISRIVLRPNTEFAVGKSPDRSSLERLHHRAHKNCFIANSIKSEMVIEF